MPKLHEKETKFDKNFGPFENWQFDIEENDLMQKMCHNNH